MNELNEREWLSDELGRNSLDCMKMSRTKARKNER